MNPFIQNLETEIKTGRNHEPQPSENHVKLIRLKDITNNQNKPKIPQKTTQNHPRQKKQFETSLVLL